MVSPKRTPIPGIRRWRAQVGVQKIFVYEPDIEHLIHKSFRVNDTGIRGHRQPFGIGDPFSQRHQLGVVVNHIGKIGFTQQDAQRAQCGMDRI